jgi:SAM-dependent MidA family methyltransferase
MKEGFECWREGYKYEVNLRMIDVLEELDQKMNSGIILTVDYGYDATYYKTLDRAEGTLMCYQQHQVVSDPYINLGQQDITAHVNFLIMQRTGERLGWKINPLVTQREFLLNWGLKKRLSEEEEQGILNPERMDARLRLKRLLVPGGISDTMKVLLKEVRLNKCL